MSEARALAAAAAAIALLVAGLPVQGPFPNPVENDAGSHTDAPQDGGLPLRPGTYIGNVTGRIDPIDSYRFDPPPATVVRVRVEPAPENRHGLVVELLNSYGSDFGGTLGDPQNVSLVSGRGESVTMDVEYVTTSEGPPPMTHEQRYLFNVTYERHDHVAQLRTDGEDAAAWSVHVPEGGYARVEATTAPDDGTWLTPGSDDLYSRLRVLKDPSSTTGADRRCMAASGYAFGHGWGPQLAGRPGPGDDTAWSHGMPVEVPDQPDVPMPWRLWPEQLGPPSLSRDVEDRHGNLSMDVGVAYNKAWGHVGWVVWDGPASRATIEERPAEFSFWTLEDFDDGDGQGVGVGPYAQADNLTKTGGLPAGDNVTRFVHVDATTPAAWLRETGQEETEMTVTAPNGSTTRLVDDHRHWDAYADDRSRSWSASEAGPGTWRYRVDHSDGTEGDRIVVTHGWFGIEDECPGDDEMW